MVHAFIFIGWVPPNHITTHRFLLSKQKGDISIRAILKMPQNTQKYKELNEEFSN
jgi:hypothetical protein